jgi:serine/threonine-protein kinase RsbW
VLGDLKLALTEACTNSVRHAYANGGGTVQIHYHLFSDRLEVVVADEGEGFTFEPREGDPDELSEGGLGIAIIRSIADEFELRSKAGERGSTLRFAKKLAG